ncbi:uncharacterized protein [Clytia hemisphaerica]
MYLKVITNLNYLKYLPNEQRLTFIRGMARRARKVDIIKPKIDINKPVDRISKGDKNIVFSSTKNQNKIHHSEKDLRTFETLNLRSDVIQGLGSLEVVNPTIIQMLSIPMINNRKNIFCAAQTGSGKTLVYAAPIISHLKNNSDDGFINRLSRPRALVVAPSRELASQILKIFKSISHHAPIRSLGLIGQHQKKWTRDYLKGIVDVVVGTPNTILKYHQRGRLLLSDLQYLVIDEADTMMDENFRKVTTEILQSCQFTESNLNSRNDTQAILTAATLPPKGILSKYQRYIKDLEICQSNLHKVLPNIKHSFNKTTEDQKIPLVIKRLENLLKRPSRKCVIFCNNSKTCNFVSIKLQEENIEHSKLHGNMNPQVRSKDYDKFVKNETRVLVCTDVASRGLDSSEITVVINYDCPFNTTDYLHRSGRTGRATEQFPGEGEIVTFITQNKQVIFAHKIQEAAMKNKSLDDDIRSKKTPSKKKYQQQMLEYEQQKKKTSKK